MKNLLRPAVNSILVFTLLTGVIYPLTVTWVARIIFPIPARGSIVTRDGRSAGSALLGQSCDDPRRFWGRPSATAPFPGNAASSRGSNLGPGNPALAEAVRNRIAALRAVDPEALGKIPADLVTASASGLDPHISPAAAAYQVPRVARTRGLDEARVRALIAAHTAGRTFGLLGEPRINVLLLNLALDEMR